MKVQYIKHSAFLVSFQEATLIFDYAEGSLPRMDKNQHIYFFVSHKHGDHFSFDIFSYVNEYPNITYILPKDMKMSANYMDRRNVPQEARSRIVYVGKNDHVPMDPFIEVETLRSTDEGVAYLIGFHGKEKKSIYHAGDMNWWTWMGETKEEYEQMTLHFQSEMEKLRGRSFDLAFVPLDPRQEERFWWGFDYFMRTADAKNVVPMHCWEDYTVIHKLLLLDQVVGYKERIIEVHHTNEWLELK